MHRDHKLGLALGVLVVGFAAALCFPKQSDIDQRLLQLENAAELDAEIVRLPVHAYTNADPQRSLSGEVAADPPVALGQEAIVPGGDGQSELLAGPPAPIAPPAAESTDHIADLDHELPADTGADGRTASTTNEPASADMQEYTVRPGDTLSSLAALFLGSHGRYLELFDANRETLATPDDLRPGMVLMVPITNRDAGKRPTDQSDRSAGTTEPVTRQVAVEHAPVESAAPHGDVSPTDEARRLFRPAGAAPFLKTRPVSRGSGTLLPPMDATSGSQPDETVEASPRTYTVRRGDTLEGIAVQTYGDARAVRGLLDANQDVVRDPRRLKPGMTLRLPE